MLMSPHGHARIKSINAEKARKAEGVLAVIAAKEVGEDKLGILIPIMPEDFGAPKGYRASRPLLDRGLPAWRPCSSQAALLHDYKG